MPRIDRRKFFPGGGMLAVTDESSAKGRLTHKFALFSSTTVKPNITTKHLFGGKRRYRTKNNLLIKKK